MDVFQAVPSKKVLRGILLLDALDVAFDITSSVERVG
jgi:hypothetical protein